MARSLVRWLVISGLCSAVCAYALEPCPEVRTWHERRLCTALAESNNQWYLHLGGASSHTQETRAAGRRWNEQHLGIGLERRAGGFPWRESEVGRGAWQTSYTAGTFADSRRFWSFYGGVALSREVVAFGRTRVHAGAGAFLFYRSRSWNGRMSLAPGLLPVLSATDETSPFGFNVIWRPPGIDGPGTVFLQITHRIR